MVPKKEADIEKTVKKRNNDKVKKKKKGDENFYMISRRQ